MNWPNAKSASEIRRVNCPLGVATGDGWCWWTIS